MEGTGEGGRILELPETAEVLLYEWEGNYMR